MAAGHDERPSERSLIQDDELPEVKEWPSDAQLLEIWALYPNKRDRGRALEKLRRALIQERAQRGDGGPETLAWMRRQVEAFAKWMEHKKPQYVPHGKTFFNPKYRRYAEDMESYSDPVARAAAIEWRRIICDEPRPT